MIKLIVSIFFAFFAFSAQAFTGSNDTIPLQVSWQPVENNYNGKEHALSVLEIKNVGNVTLPKTGWRLYFNFVRIISPKNAVSPFDVHHVNGDLFYFAPSVEFEGLRPGESIQYEMVSHSWVVNLNDAPQGFYVVWDDRRIQPLPPVAVLRPADDKKFYRVANDREMSAEVLYAKNEKIKPVSDSEVIPVFPTPLAYVKGDGVFLIDKEVSIFSDATFEQEANFLGSELSKMLGYSFPLSKKKKTSSRIIRFLQDENLAGEGYKLDVTPASITIRAGTALGAFYAVQSLKTLIPPRYYATENPLGIEVLAVSIVDEPRFGRRAVMLDIARNFQTKEQIKKMLDIMALYKLNTLHFHLNDDEGWRLEIPSFPELTAVSGRRGHLYEGEAKNLPPSYGSGPFVDQTSGSGFYSRSDFVEILKYAHDRHIQIIPEIETPGHARSSIRAMEERYHRLLEAGNREGAEKYLLQHLDDLSEYRSVQKWNDNVMDVSMPSVYNFLDVVTDDVIAIYRDAGAPLATIHFGGDEVPSGVWEKSPAVDALKKSNPDIKDTNDLWDYFFDQIYHMMERKGLYITGWEEVGLHKVRAEHGRTRWVPNEKFKGRNIHVNVWNNLLGNEDLAYRLANSGYKVILSFVNNFYFDMAYHKKFEEPGFYWGGFIDLEKPFSFIPFDYLKNQKDDYLGRPLRQAVLDNAVQLTEFGKSNIVGIQGLLWAETVKTPEQMEYMIFPRILALAEKAWAKSPEWAEHANAEKASELYQKDLSEFYARVGYRELKRLDYYVGGIHYRIPSLGVKLVEDKVYVNCELPGFTVRYTTDGSVPSIDSPIYIGPLLRQKNMTFRTFNDLGRGGQVSTLED